MHRRWAAATYGLLALSTVALGFTWGTRFRASQAPRGALSKDAAVRPSNSEAGPAGIVAPRAVATRHDDRPAGASDTGPAPDPRYLSIPRDYAPAREAAIAGLRVRSDSTTPALAFPRASPAAPAPVASVADRPTPLDGPPSTVVATSSPMLAPTSAPVFPGRTDEIDAHVADALLAEGPFGSIGRQQADSQVAAFAASPTDPRSSPPPEAPVAFVAAPPVLDDSPFVAAQPIVSPSAARAASPPDPLHTPAVPSIESVPRGATLMNVAPMNAAPISAVPVEGPSHLVPLENAAANDTSPNPWSYFFAGSGLGGFTRHGTITLEDVRLAALRNNPDIAVLGHVPRITAADIVGAESVFDPVFNLAAAGGHYDRQTSTQVESLGTSVPVLKTTFWQPITSPNQVWIDKQFRTGGRVVAGIGQNYLNYSPAGSFVFVNPAHQASLNLSLEQPLFRGRGTAATMTGVQIARANQQQSVHVFRALVNAILRDAETAYWETYAAYQEFEVRDVALAQASETVARERERLRIGEGALPDTALAEEQAEAFRIARSEAEADLATAQRSLRRVMGLPVDDPRPLIPATAPIDVPIVIDPERSAVEALRRPEIAAQQAVVAAADLELRRRRNGLLPDVSLRGLYSVSGLDRQFDGAWASLGSWNYNDWTAGVVYRQPLGRRADRALAQRAVEALSMESARLRQMEHALGHELAAACERVAATERLLDMHRRRREAAAVTLDARRELYLENRALLRDQLDAEERYAGALLDEALAKIEYQRALVQWNFARGGLEDDLVVSE